MASWAPRREAIKTRVLTCWGDQAMLRIAKDSDGCVTRLILSGRIQSVDTQLQCMDKNRELARGRGLRPYQVTLNLLQSLTFSFRHPCQYKEKTCHTNSSVDPESSGHAQPVVQNGKGERQKKRSQPES